MSVLVKKTPESALEPQQRTVQEIYTLVEDELLEEPNAEIGKSIERLSRQEALELLDQLITLVARQNRVVLTHAVAASSRPASDLNQESSLAHSQAYLTRYMEVQDMAMRRCLQAEEELQTTIENIATAAEGVLAMTQSIQQTAMGILSPLSSEMGSANPPDSPSAPQQPDGEGLPNRQLAQLYTTVSAEDATEPNTGIDAAIRQLSSQQAQAFLSHLLNLYADAFIALPTKDPKSHAYCERLKQLMISVRQQWQEAA